MKKIKVPTTEKLEINVRRKNLVEDSFHQIMKLQENDIKKLRDNLWIVFMGETGQDYGSITCLLNCLIPAMGCLNTLPIMTIDCKSTLTQDCAMSNTWSCLGSLEEF